MNYSKFAATALLAVAATSVAAGTSYAAPADTQAQPATGQAQGQQQGVDYVVALADQGNSIVTQVTGGKFAVTSDGKAVVLKNAAGDVVTQVALSSVVGDQHVDLAANVAEDGSRLTLTSINAPLVANKDISAQDDFFAQLQHASLGALIGGIIGFFFVGIGAPIGAVIGLLIAGGQPLIDSGSAYFSGQP